MAMPVLKKVTHDDLVATLREERIKNGIDEEGNQDERMYAE